MTQELLQIGAVPAPTASAREIIKHLALVRNRIRADQAETSALQPRRLVESNLFIDLIACISVPYVDGEQKWADIASDPKCMAMIDELRAYRDDAEYDAEIVCCDEIIEGIQNKGGLALHVLNRFSLMPNYRLYHEIETNLLRGLGQKLDQPDLSVMFIGSGPLPVTAWLLTEAISANPRSSMTCVELVPEANERGHAFFSSLLGQQTSPELPTLPTQNSGQVDFITSNALALSPTMIASQDVIYVAAMVNRPSKRKVLRYLVQHMQPGSTLVCRSGNGLKRIVGEHVEDAWFDGTKGEIEMRAQSNRTFLGQVIVRIKPEHACCHACH